MALELSVWLPLFRQKLRKLEKRIPETPKEVARWGATKAKTIAPIDTGSLIQAIAWNTTPGKKKSSATIFVRNTRNTKHRGIYGRVPRYAALQHRMSIGAKTQAKTGDPHWMFTIQKEAKDRFRTELKKGFDEFKK